MASGSFYKVIVFIPEKYLGKVKEAMFSAGGGRQGNYSECCWVCRGQGQFRPLAGSQPALGNVGQLENVDEVRLEMLADCDSIRAVIDALLSAHPYEEPAYEIYPLMTSADFT